MLPLETSIDLVILNWRRAKKYIVIRNLTPLKMHHFPFQLIYSLKFLILTLTKPCLSEMLFVNFSLWKETTFCIHCSPVLGESGWIYILLGISGSAFPATIQRELWNLYLQSSTATVSMRRMYLARLSKPVTRTLYGGNIRLKDTDWIYCKFGNFREGLF